VVRTRERFTPRADASPALAERYAEFVGELRRRGWLEF
jgi:hypothetical protein